MDHDANQVSHKDEKHTAGTGAHILLLTTNPMRIGYELNRDIAPRYSLAEDHSCEQLGEILEIHPKQSIMVVELQVLSVIRVCLSAKQEKGIGSNYVPKNVG